MLGPNVMLKATIVLVAAAAHLVVAAAIASRPAAREARVGQDSFVAWWVAMGAAMGALGALLLLAHSGRAPLALLLATIETFVLANSVAAAAILGHVAYVLTGSARLMRLAWVVLLVDAFAFTTLLFALDIHAIRGVGDDLVVEGSGTLAPGVLTFLVLLFFAPHLLAAGAYLLMMLRAPDAGSRDRAGLLAASVLLTGFSASFVMLADEMQRADLALLFYGLVALSPVAALLAYVPPDALRRRWQASAREAWED